MNSINWPASSVWVFIAQLGEHCSANAEATGSNPVEAPKIFFSGYFRNCLNCDSLRWSHTHFICIPAVHIISFKNFTITSTSLKHGLEGMTSSSYPLWCLYFSTSRKGTPPVSGHLCLVPRVSAYGRFECIWAILPQGHPTRNNRIKA